VSSVIITALMVIRKMKRRSNYSGRTLILGLGNTLLGDEGIGVWVINRIRDEGIVLPDNVDLADGGTAGYDLMLIMQGYDRVVIVDAINIPDRPGSIYRFLPEHAPVPPAGFSLHETGVFRVLRLMEIMGCCPDIECIGIVPEKTGFACMEISRVVRESFPAIISEVMDAVSLNNGEVSYGYKQA